MAWRNYLQDHPGPLGWAWEATAWVLRRARPWLERVGLERASRWLLPVETALKKPLFDCQACGQCVLHYTGMTCPMTCPKQLRNGPCGGVRANGHCEVYPERPCVWVQALTRIERTPYAAEKHRLNPPVDWRLEGMASWATHALERDQIPTGSETLVRYATERWEEVANEAR